MSEEFGILVGQCTGVLFMVIFCIWLLVVLPLTDWLIIMGIFVGTLLLIGGITLWCMKFGDGCHGTETTPTIRIHNYRIVEV